MNEKDKEIQELKDRLNKLEESSEDKEYEELKKKSKSSCLNLIVGAIILTIFFLWLGSDIDDSEQNTDKEEKKEKIERQSPSQAQISQILALLKSENEEVVDAFYNEGGVYNWVVGVNGTGNWMGYSSALCNTLYEVGILGKDISHDATIEHRLRVVNISKFIETNGHFRKSSLGSTNCKTWKSDMP